MALEACGVSAASPTVTLGGVGVPLYGISDDGKKTCKASLDFTTNGMLTIQELESAHDPSLNFDEDGSINQRGLFLLGYLKAKSLYKLERYSECLFQLAKIKVAAETNR